MKVKVMNTRIFLSSFRDRTARIGFLYSAGPSSSLFSILLHYLNGGSYNPYSFSVTRLTFSPLWTFGGELLDGGARVYRPTRWRARIAPLGPPNPICPYLGAAAAATRVPHPCALAILSKHNAPQTAPFKAPLAACITICQSPHQISSILLLLFIMKDVIKNCLFLVILFN